MKSFEDEIQKIALTRWQKERRKDPSIFPELAQRTGLQQIGAVEEDVRRKLVAPAERSPSSLARKRTMASKLYEAQARPELHKGVHAIIKETMPLTPPSTTPISMLGSSMIVAPRTSGRVMRSMIEEPSGVLERRVPRNLRALAATLEETPGSAGRLGRRFLASKSPTDPTLTHATLRHELGEAAELNRPSFRPFASHIGVTPILEEQIALRGDPQATKSISKLRELHPDDAMVQKLIRQAGGTPDAPLPLGGKQQRSLEKMLVHKARAGHLRPSTQSAAVRLGIALDKPIEYIPKGLLPRRAEVKDQIEGALRAAKEREWKKALTKTKGIGKRIASIYRYLKR